MQGCRYVCAIIVSWNDISREPPKEIAMLATTTGSVLSGTSASTAQMEATGSESVATNSSIPELNATVPVTILERETCTNLSNQFRPRESILTAAVFRMDDDVTPACAIVDAGYKFWNNSHNRENLFVTFAARQLNIASGDYRFDFPWRSGTWNAAFVTKGGFLHRRFHELIHSDQYAKLRHASDAVITGEDILMAAVHAQHTPTDSKIPCQTVLMAMPRAAATNSICSSLSQPSLQSRWSFRTEFQIQLHADLGNVFANRTCEQGLYIAVYNTDGSSRECKWGDTTDAGCDIDMVAV
jgi:hypothetical protein